MMDMNTIKNGISLKLAQDYSYNPNPREDDNLGEMVCFHRRYNLGDKTEFERPFDFQVYAENNQNDICCILSLYLYDHSGITISTTPFADKWDSGQVGYIYCTKEKAKKFGLNPENYDEIEKQLQAEVKAYDDYLTGNDKYYYFCLRDENNEIIDTITGFKGKSFKEVISEMKEYADDKYHGLFDDLLKKLMKKESYM